MTGPTPHLDAVKAELDQALADFKFACTQLAETRASLAAARRVNQFYVEENARLKQRLATVRPVLVARDFGNYCQRCDGPVARGQAYEQMPGTGGIQHLHCPITTTKE